MDASDIKLRDEPLRSWQERWIQLLLRQIALGLPPVKLEIVSVAKLQSLGLPFDAMVGKDVETGLANLKTVVESQRSLELAPQFGDDPIVALALVSGAATLSSGWRSAATPSQASAPAAISMKSAPPR
jgi:hypothetical protein